MKTFTKSEWKLFWLVRFTILLFYITFTFTIYSLSMFEWYIVIFFTTLMFYLFVFETISLYRYNKNYVDVTEREE